MEKLTLSVKNPELIAWAKDWAKTNQTSLSALFEAYLVSIQRSAKHEVELDDDLAALRQVGLRPSEREVHNILYERRARYKRKKKK